MDLGEAYADLIKSGACTDAYDLMNIARPRNAPQDVAEACFGRLHAASMRAHAARMAPKVQSFLVELLRMEQCDGGAWHPSIEQIAIPQPLELWERACSACFWDASEREPSPSRALLDFASNVISFRLCLPDASAFRELHSRLRNLDWGLDGAMLIGVENGLRRSRKLSCASDARGHSCSLKASLLVNMCSVNLSPVLISLRLEYARTNAWDGHLRLLGELIRGDFDHPWLRVSWERLLNVLAALTDAEESGDAETIKRALYEARAEGAPQERLDKVSQRLQEIEPAASKIDSYDSYFSTKVE